MKKGCKVRRCRGCAWNPKQKVKERSLNETKSVIVMFDHLHVWVFLPEGEK